MTDTPDDYLDHEINGDADLKEMVRSITDYDREHLDDPTLDMQIRAAKLRVKNEADSSKFYEDDGLSQALLYTTAILAKCAAENYSLDRWNLGDAQIEARYAGDSDQAQFAHWAEMAAEGIRSSEEASVQPTPEFTNTFIG